MYTLSSPRLLGLGTTVSVYNLGNRTKSSSLYPWFPNFLFIFR